MIKFLVVTASVFSILSLISFCFLREKPKDPEAPPASEYEIFDSSAQTKAISKRINESYKTYEPKQDSELDETLFKNNATASSIITETTPRNISNEKTFPVKNQDLKDFYLKPDNSNAFTKLNGKAPSDLSQTDPELNYQILKLGEIYQVKQKELSRLEEKYKSLGTELQLGQSISEAVGWRYAGEQSCIVRPMSEFKKHDTHRAVKYIYKDDRNKKEQDALLPQLTALRKEIQTLKLKIDSMQTVYSGKMEKAKGEAAISKTYAGRQDD